MSARDLTSKSAARMAATLDMAPNLTPDRLRADFPYWRIWWSAATQTWHAIRDDPSGRFEVSQSSPRRFHLDSDSLGGLALLLIVQHAIDAADTDKEGAHHGKAHPG